MLITGNVHEQSILSFVFPVLCFTFPSNPLQLRKSKLAGILIKLLETLEPFILHIPEEVQTWSILNLRLP